VENFAIREEPQYMLAFIQLLGHAGFYTTAGTCWLLYNCWDMLAFIQLLGYAGFYTTAGICWLLSSVLPDDTHRNTIMEV
jgi:hypothetical protein